MKKVGLGLHNMVFDAAFNNISVILCRGKMVDNSINVKIDPTSRTLIK